MTSTTTRDPRRRRLAAAVAAALVLGASAGTGVTIAAGLGTDSPATTRATAGTPVAASSTLTVGQVYEKTADGVVQITASGVIGSTEPFGPAQESEATGSGFVLDEEGHIVTNAHVVEGATSLSVTFANGKEVSATVVGTDPSTDLAVIDVDLPASELEPLALGDESSVEVGDAVVAIGSPFGLAGTVTTGIVSALDRTIDAPNGYAIDGAIQTDAAINHGNSGGPLLDAAGNVIGVNAQIASESGGNDGVGFAIGVDTVKKVAAALASGEEVTHAYLGVSLEETDDGPQVTAVTSGSPAAEAGVQVGDLVVELDGTRISSADALRQAIADRDPGSEVTVTVVRDGQRVELHASLGTRPA